MSITLLMKLPAFVNGIDAKEFVSRKMDQLNPVLDGLNIYASEGEALFLNINTDSKIFVLGNFLTGLSDFFKTHGIAYPVSFKRIDYDRRVLTADVYYYGADWELHRAVDNLSIATLRISMSLCDNEELNAELLELNSAVHSIRHKAKAAIKHQLYSDPYGLDRELEHHILADSENLYI